MPRCDDEIVSLTAVDMIELFATDKDVFSIAAKCNGTRVIIRDKDLVSTRSSSGLSD